MQPYPLNFPKSCGNTSPSSGTPPWKLPPGSETIQKKSTEKNEREKGKGNCGVKGRKKGAERPEVGKHDRNIPKLSKVRFQQEK